MIPAPLSTHDFGRIRHLLSTRSGIVIAPDKQDFVRNRLARRLKALGLSSFGDYCAIVEAPGSSETALFVNALTTNHTHFFRERHHFDDIADRLVPSLVTRAHRSGQRRIRIWSSASSSGEEPYSIAMTLRHALPDFQRWDARILATDIDSAVLARARDGIYPRSEIGRIPSERIPGAIADGPGPQTISMTDAVRRLVVFKQLNLLGRWPMKGPFDAIFCRNVMIYFDRNTQRAILDRFAGLLTLYIGHSESLVGLSDRFILHGRTIYTLAPAP